MLCNILDPCFCLDLLLLHRREPPSEQHGQSQDQHLENSPANAHGWTTFYKFTALSFLLHGAGDFLLGEDFFKIGLGAFLVAHLMNIKAFNANANAEVKEKLPFPGQQRYYLPFLVVLIIALAFLFAVGKDR